MGEKKMNKELLLYGIVISSILMFSACVHPEGFSVSEQTSLKQFAEEFKNPSKEHRPKVRWWWPGGDVTADELVREINLLDEAGFGGAEIQPFDYSLNPALTSDPENPVKDFMTPSFLSKLSKLLEEARGLDMVIDLTMGSGYCAGADFVELRDNEKTLVSADITVAEDQIEARIPAPGKNAYYEMYAVDAVNPMSSGWKVLNYYPEKAELLALFAVGIVGGTRDPDYRVLKDTLVIDLSTVEMINDYNIESGTFNWRCPDRESQWQIIAAYSMPVGSFPIGSVEVGAPGETAYMVDILNKAAVLRYYKNWLTMLSPVMDFSRDGTFRAVFNDSFEFYAQRMYTDGFLDVFREVNGYDIAEYMPSVLMLKDGIGAWFMRDLAPEFSFTHPEMSGIDARINYDYDNAISTAIIDGWYKASLEALGKAGLLLRQQGYNPPLDRILAVKYT